MLPSRGDHFTALFAGGNFSHAQIIIVKLLGSFQGFKGPLVSGLSGNGPLQPSVCSGRVISFPEDFMPALKNIHMSWSDPPNGFLARIMMEVILWCGEVRKAKR